MNPKTIIRRLKPVIIALLAAAATWGAHAASPNLVPPTETYAGKPHSHKPLPVGQHVVHISNNGFIGTPNEWVSDVVWTINVVAPGIGVIGLDSRGSTHRRR